MDELLDDLEARVKKMLLEVNEMKSDLTAIRKTPANGGWSALQCLHHLNLYSAFYLPVLEHGIRRAKARTAAKYQPGWFGNKTALSMLPEHGKIKNPMKTFKSKNPILTSNTDSELNKFLKNQDSFLSLFDQARTKDLASKRVKTTLPLVKFKLGDAMRFVVFHEVRHITQAKHSFYDSMPEYSRK